MGWVTIGVLTTDRRRFRVAGRGLFDESNRHGDALDFYRDDYSVHMHGDGSGTPPELDLKKSRPAWLVLDDNAQGGGAQTGRTLG